MSRALSAFIVLYLVGAAATAAMLTQALHEHNPGTNVPLTFVIGAAAEWPVTIALLRTAQD